LATKGQDWVLDKLGLREHLGLDPEQRAADAAQHPIAEFAGDVLPALLTMRPDAAATMGARALSGAVLGGSEAAQEYANNGELSPGRIAASAAAGAVLPNMRKPSSMIADYMLKRGAVAPKGTGTGVPQAPASENENIGGRTPTPGADEADISIANDLTTTSRGVAAENPPAPEITGAGNPVGAPMVAREAAAPSDPTRDYRKDGTGATAKDKIETAPTKDGVTVSEERPADITAALSPMERAQPTPPESEDIPPFLQRTETGLAQPGPLNAPAKPAGQQEQAHVQTGIAEAAGGGQPSAPQANPGVKQQPQVPAQPEPGGTAEPSGNTLPTEIDHPIIQQAIQLAMRRPIVEQPMPSIANSSRNPKGPVVVDPTVPP
jgi:hypothetical protein